MRSKSLRGKMIGVLAVFLALFMGVGVAQEEITDAGGQWKYVLEDGGATITRYLGECDSDLLIPDELGGHAVTGIGDSAFHGCSGITSVTIPDSVASIGKEAFYGCNNLARATIPASVTYIGEGAFDETLAQPGHLYETHIELSVKVGSYAARYAEENNIDYVFAGEARTDAGGQWKYVLEETGATITGYAGEAAGDLVIPDQVDGHAVTGIGDSAFKDLSRVTGVTIPDSVTVICRNAFSYCDELTSVTIPGSVKSIGHRAFGYCGVTDVVIADGVTSIGDRAFERCMDLTSVTIPNSVTSIGLGAFRSCYSLNDVVIPNGVTTIGMYAFAHCLSLTSVTIPDSVTSMTNPFMGCFVACINVSPGNTRYEQIDGVLFDKQQKTLVSYPGAKKGIYAIPEGVLHIGASAFADCDGLTEVIIPDSVTSIGEGAFNGCGSLTSVAIPAGVTVISDYALSGCGGLAGVTIPDSVTVIGDNAFAFCYSLTSATIPGSVTVLGDNAFAFCYSLTSATIPASVTSIGEEAFAWCEELTVRVTKDSYAEQYAQENSIPYVFIAE